MSTTVVYYGRVGSLHTLASQSSPISGLLPPDRLFQSDRFFESAHRFDGFLRDPLDVGPASNLDIAVPHNLADGEVIGSECSEIRRQTSTESVIALPLDVSFLQSGLNHIAESVCRRQGRQLTVVEEIAVVLSANE